ncbi:MAG: hypothetical protein ACJ8GJ_19900 [Vitreoscilla sp.]
MKLSCPHCSLRALSAPRKMLLGPAASLGCRACGLRLGVEPVRAYVSFVPCLAAVVGVQGLHDVDSMIAAGVAALVLTFALYLQWVPLVKRQITDPDAVRRAVDRADGLRRAS